MKIRHVRTVRTPIYAVHGVRNAILPLAKGGVSSRHSTTERACGTSKMHDIHSLGDRQLTFRNAAELNRHVGGSKNGSP